MLCMRSLAADLALLLHIACCLNSLIQLAAPAYRQALSDTAGLSTARLGRVEYSTLVNPSLEY